MSGEALYRAFADHLRFPGGDDEIVIDGVTGRVHALSQAQARVLAGCRGARSLDEHAALAARLLGAAGPGPEAARALVETLATRGLLASEAELQAGIAAAVRPPRERPAIEMLGIPTNGRPALLAEHLRSHAAHARAHGRAVTFVVADSSSGEAAEATRAVLASLAAEGLAIRAALPEDRARHAPLLAARAGVDRAIVDFALGGDARFGFDAGANRNCLLLDSAGAPFLFSDDDVRPRVVAAPAPGPSSARSAPGYGDARVPIETGGARLLTGDPNEMWFGDPGSPLVPEDRFEDIDLFALHESMLGADVARAATAGADTSAASAAFFRRLFHRGGRVAITQLGSAGDHGMASSFGLLLLTGASRARLLASEPRFVHAFTRRLVVKCPARPSIADGASSMTMSTALDAREILPPFAPSGRDSDGLFGALVRACVPDAFSGHLPFAIEHVPPEPRVTSFEIERAAAGRTTSNELLRLALSATFDARGPSPEALLVRAGRALQGLASRPREASDFFREHVVRGLARRLAQMERLAAEQSRTPAFWAAALDGFAASLRAALAHPTAHLPFDLVAAHGPDRAEELLVLHVARVGLLLEAWPSLFAAARALRAEGARLSRAVARA